MEPISLTAMCDELLAAAHAEPGGRAARTVHGDCTLTLRQMAVALVAGREAEYQSAGNATVQILRGRIRIDNDGTSTELSAGDLVPVPLIPHWVAALEDSVVLMTVDIRS
ncbi:MAG: LuxR family transcriptional regulator [Dermatophilus congolensis]|nr:LuxR family transcriptional regulator [Dermatophilus congolensis]